MMDGVAEGNTVVKEFVSGTVVTGGPVPSGVLTVVCD